MPHQPMLRSMRIALSGSILLLVCAVASFADFGDPDMPPPPVAAGTKAPTFTTTTLSGKSFSSSSLNGHVTILDFWATWCGPCKMAIPGLEKIYKSYHSKGVDVVGMSLDTDTVSQVPSTIRSLGVTYTVAANPKQNLSAGRDYNAAALPSLYILDKHGIVRWSFSGYYDGQDNDIRAELDRLLKKK